jgi:heptaprenyl diphosphate synthase
MFWDQFPVLKDELVDFEDYLESHLKSKQPLLEETVSRLAKAGGKRIRPALIITSAHFGDYDQEKVWSVASAMEMLHMATLIHDDIIDEAELRRGAETVQSKYGKDTAVFTGDYLFSLTFSTLSGSASQKELTKIAEVVQRICEGEVQQHENRYELSISYKDYLRRIRGKTALLFEGSCALGAQIGNLGKLNTRRLAHYGRYLGMGFQLTDDILDFTASAKELGKPENNDFTQGIYTLPILHVVK